MAGKLTLEVAIPERLLVEEEVDEVEIPAADGYLGAVGRHGHALGFDADVDPGSAERADSGDPGGVAFGLDGQALAVSGLAGDPNPRVADNASGDTIAWSGESETEQVESGAKVGDGGWRGGGDGEGCAAHG